MTRIVQHQQVAAGACLPDLWGVAAQGADGEAMGAKAGIVAPAANGATVCLHWT